MDNKINEFDELIKQKTNNYKNICLLWKNWIKIKKKRFSEELDIAIEKIKGSPVSEMTLEYSMRIGIVLVVSLMIIQTIGLNQILLKVMNKISFSLKKKQ